MKRLLLFMALLAHSVGLMAQTKINFTDKNKVKHTYTKTVISIVKTDDGKLFYDTAETAITATKVKSLYDNALSKPPVVIPPISDIKTISFLEFANLSDVSDKKYKVTPGNYKQGIYHKNLKNVTFYGDGLVNISDLKTPALTIAGKSVNVSYEGFNFKNINSYQIVVESADKNVYNGSEGSFIDGLKINKFTFDGGGSPFHSDGNVRSKNVHDGVLKGFVFSNNTVKNIPGAKFMVYLGNGFDFDIFGNTFENINKQNNEDNGMFYLKATGKLHNNKATNYQGYLARIWPHSIDGRKTVYVYDNVGYNGDKYGLIELQFSPDFLSRGAQIADAKVYNNTALNLNKTNDWGGALLTLYPLIDNFGGVANVDYYNNLGANLSILKGNTLTRNYADIVKANMIFIQSESYKLNVTGQNLYFEDPLKAVKDLNNFESLFSGVGAKLN